jgi:hypothetical protein
MDLVSVLQLRDSTRNLIHAFGRKPPKPWTQQADGFYLSPSGKKRLSPESYERHKARLKQRESRPAKAAAAKPAATKTTPQQTASPAAQYKPDDLKKAIQELNRREQGAASYKRAKGVDSQVYPGLIEKSKAKVAEIEKSLRASGNLPPATASQYRPDPRLAGAKNYLSKIEADLEDQQSRGLSGGNLPGLVAQMKAKVADMEKDAPKPKPVVYTKENHSLPSTPSKSNLPAIANEVEKAYAQDRAKFGTKSANVIRRVRVAARRLVQLWGFRSGRLVWPRVPSLVACWVRGR